ncbi:hypothetical protein Btru_069507 [Bulinus truncatus]|nr:hypothetical protein Btru_069507 [Bulinus truncatus]
MNQESLLDLSDEVNTALDIFINCVVPNSLGLMGIIGNILNMLHSSLYDSASVTAEEKVLELCGQAEPVSFYSCIPKRELSNLSNNNEINQTDNFCQVRRISCVKGHFPDILQDKWDDFDRKEESENDHPDQFPIDQLFIMFECYDGGCTLEQFKFTNPLEIFSTVRQVVFALAVAEECLEFEHRDLHMKNILVKPYQQETVLFKLNGCHFMFPSEGVFATIIDFTLSRLKKDGCAFFFDVSTHDYIFEATGHFLFDVYRDMKTENSNDWQRFNPHSNILWINYLCRVMMDTLKKGKYGSRSNPDVQKKLQHLLDVILDYTSCLHLALDSIIWS